MADTSSAWKRSPLFWPSTFPAAAAAAVGVVSSSSTAHSTSSQNAPALTPQAVPRFSYDFYDAVQQVLCSPLTVNMAEKFHILFSLRPGIEAPFFAYDSRKDLAASKECLLALWVLLLQRTEELSVLHYRHLCLRLMVAIMRRDEFKLRFLPHEERPGQKHCQSSTLRMAGIHRQLVRDTFLFASRNLSRVAFTPEIVEFAAQVFAFSFFCLPPTQAPLIDAVSWRTMNFSQRLSEMADPLDGSVTRFLQLCRRWRDQLQRESEGSREGAIGEFVDFNPDVFTWNWWGLVGEGSALPEDDSWRFLVSHDGVLFTRFLRYYTLYVATSLRTSPARTPDNASRNSGSASTQTQSGGAAAGEGSAALSSWQALTQSLWQSTVLGPFASLSLLEGRQHDQSASSVSNAKSDITHSFSLADGGKQRILGDTVEEIPESNPNAYTGFENDLPDDPEDGSWPATTSSSEAEGSIPAKRAVREDEDNMLQQTDYPPTHTKEKQSKADGRCRIFWQSIPGYQQLVEMFLPLLYKSILYYSRAHVAGGVSPLKMEKNEMHDNVDVGPEDDLRPPSPPKSATKHAISAKTHFSPKTQHSPAADPVGLAADRRRSSVEHTISPESPGSCGPSLSTVTTELEKSGGGCAHPSTETLTSTLEAAPLLTVTDSVAESTLRCGSVLALNPALGAVMVRLALAAVMQGSDYLGGAALSKCPFPSQTFASQSSGKTARADEALPYCPEQFLDPAAVSSSAVAVVLEHVTRWVGTMVQVAVEGIHTAVQNFVKAPGAQCKGPNHLCAMALQRQWQDLQLRQLREARLQVESSKPASSMRKGAGRRDRDLSESVHCSLGRGLQVSLFPEAVPHSDLDGIFAALSKLIAGSSCSVVLVAALSAVYNLLPVSTPQYKEAFLKKCFLQRHGLFLRLFLHQNATVRSAFHHLLVYRFFTLDRRALGLESDSLLEMWHQQCDATATNVRSSAGKGSSRGGSSSSGFGGHSENADGAEDEDSELLSGEGDEDETPVSSWVSHEDYFVAEVALASKLETYIQFAVSSHTSGPENESLQGSAERLARETGALEAIASDLRPQLLPSLKAYAALVTVVARKERFFRRQRARRGRSRRDRQRTPNQCPPFSRTQCGAPPMPRTALAVQEQ